MSRNLERSAAARGGTLELLVDGSILVTIGGVGIATDQAAQAARCALALRALDADRPMALAMGRAEISGQMPFGAIIDRATQMLIARERAGSDERTIAVDDVTAGLLDASFEIGEGEDGFSLLGEHDLAEGTRTLLGKPTACVGRDWELATLEAFLTECIDEPMSRGVLVTGPPGMGKSRLSHEVMRRYRLRDGAPEIWVGRVDALQADSAFSLLGQALKNALDIRDGEPLDSRQQKLRSRVGAHVPEAQRARVTQFLGELTGTPFRRC